MAAGAVLCCNLDRNRIKNAGPALYATACHDNRSQARFQSIHPLQSHPNNEQEHRQPGRPRHARTMGLFKAAALLALLACAPFLIELASRKEYPVPVAGGGVIVTGASTGIGRHAAEALAKEGFVVFAGVRKEADGENVKAADPDHIVPLILDVTKQEQVDAAVQTVQEELGRRGGVPLVGLVNNAGVAGSSEPVETLSLEHFTFVHSVNVLGPLRMLQAFLPMLRQAKGRVINISSVAGIISSPLMSKYCSSKWALEAISDSARVELADHGVSVSVVQPAYVKSEIFGKQEEKSAQFQALYGHVVPDPEFSRQCIEKASEPSVTSDAILHALVDPHPRTRYVVANVNGKPAVLYAWLKWALNDRLRDQLVLWSLKLRQKKD